MLYVQMLTNMIINLQMIIGALKVAIDKDISFFATFYATHNALAVFHDVSGFFEIKKFFMEVELFDLGQIEKIFKIRRF